MTRSQCDRIMEMVLLHGVAVAGMAKDLISLNFEFFWLALGGYYLQ
jgi:hypothetical protein